jgi:phage anti-repressor protein
MNNNNHDKEILATPARELHQLFAVKTNYNFWIRNMIKRCKLKEDIDFVYDKGEMLLLTTNKNNEKREIKAIFTW